jgi:hypothetical protein
MSLRTLLLPCHGPMLCLMVGPWSVIRPRPTLMIPSDVVPGLSMTSVLTTCVNRRVCFPLPKTMTLTVCNNFSNLELRTTFGNSCNVILYDVKYDGDCISGLTFVWGNLIWSCIGGLSGRYPTGQGVTPFEARWSPWERTCVLEPV